MKTSRLDRGTDLPCPVAGSGDARLGSAPARLTRPTPAIRGRRGSFLADMGSGNALELARSRALLQSMGRAGAASAPTLSSKPRRSIPENERLLKWLLVNLLVREVLGARLSNGPWDRLVVLPGVGGEVRTMVSVPEGGCGRVLHFDLDSTCASAVEVDDLGLAGSYAIDGGDPSLHGVVSTANHAAQRYARRSQRHLGMM